MPPPLSSCSLPSGRDADVIYATEDKDYVYVEHRHHVEHPVFHLTSWSSCLLKVTLKIQSGDNNIYSLCLLEGLSELIYASSLARYLSKFANHGSCFAKENGFSYPLFR